ncbi:uncharacterized protein isoform X4 [Rhodnius prolixus]|uniref:uncharacterized protein isoform X4 n=1 Tax=Rhodnius prolixus TaxID=13249 RepID=UPI003D18BC3D
MYSDNTFICQSNCNSVLFHSIRWLKDGIDEPSIQFNTYRDNTFICQSNCNSVLFHSIRWLKEALMKHPFNSTLTEIIMALMTHPFNSSRTEIIHSFANLIVTLYYSIQSDG